jgi:hypothetical protein
MQLYGYFISQSLSLSYKIDVKRKNERAYTGVKRMSHELNITEIKMELTEEFRWRTSPQSVAHWTVSTIVQENKIKENVHNAGNVLSKSVSKRRVAVKERIDR